MDLTNQPLDTPYIIERHEGFCIVFKPIGWTVQKDAQAPGILEWVTQTLSVPCFPVHRLDKPTSGLLIVALTRDANQKLSQLFASKEIQKTYLAISDQKPKKKQGWIKGDMASSRRGQYKLLRSQENPAITYFESELIEPGIRGFKLFPKTGKTHQLRVAMKSIGSPILGDALYSGSPSARLYLHAWQLAFDLEGRKYSVIAPPKDPLFRQWLESDQND
ncbi:TIGR01621 family pseudouridine synthase [Reinekea marina]|uniref:TIGR01621 family pseudouridine synthase n=1 Tax=Reinekea marina TaxID=1310421 RepID=A0ABV7WTI0_9GAMM|nr:TIGR01621 family pseudouridine synthase [Reinekea marina]MDN3647325.1 TIGR01621 family pseudouridine synthase [Reinekea marina]MDN3651081.1 TIGR01621 family pseudouridine synthase [Reinekea marina]